MKSKRLIVPVITVLVGVAAACSPGATPAAPAPAAADDSTSVAPAPEKAICGPQSPRDISSTAGTNPGAVPAGETPHLCNVHFHEPFEHSGFTSVPEVSGNPGAPACKLVEVGDQIEFHWVYTNCEPNPTPVKGLDNCVCDRDDLVLRVYAQAYVVGGTGEAPTQPQGELVTYTGSTTGPSYDDQTCSPARVNWEVAPAAEVVAKNELSAWCQNNPWIDEDRPHESRDLVTAPAELSPM